MKFPEGMLWGSASADIQYEGGFAEDGRMPTTHDYILAGSGQQPRMLTYQMPDGSRGKAYTQLGKNCDIPQEAVPVMEEGAYYPSHEAVDFYHHYKEDIQLLAGMGLNCMRFSICWSRIFPKGDEERPNEKGLQFYENVIDECIANGIEPLITICHDELPVYIAEKYNGWLNRKTIELYVNLCQVLFTRFGSKVKYWITFNEVNLLKGYSRFGVKEDSLQVKFQCTHHIFLASSLAILLGRQLMPYAKFSAMFAMSPSYSETCNPADVLANVQQERMTTFYIDVMVRGKYPAYQLNYLKENNIDIRQEPEDLNLLKQNTLDFVSFSCYRSTVASAGEYDYKKMMAKNPYLKKNAWGWAVDPYSLRHACNFIWERYQVPVFIVENGLGEIDTPDENMYVKDDYRIQYLSEHFLEIKKAVEADGVEILGYTMWGGIDLVSLSTGEMKKRYGWIYVDMDDMGNGSKRRVPKKSYYWMKELLASKGENLKATEE